MSKDLALQQVEWDLHENPETFIPLEFTEEIKPEIYGLEPKEANQLTSGIDVITAELKVLKNAYVDVIELEITTENLPIFKDLRKNFTKNRTSREKLRKAKKSYFLNGGRFVDAIFKNIDAECELMEAKLLEAEKYFENLEKQKAKDLNDSRIERLRPYGDFEFMDFAPMNDEDFDDYLLGKKTRFENAQKEAEAEAQRIEKERLKTIETNRRINLQSPYSGYLDLSHLDISELSLEEFEAVLERCKKAKIEFDKKQAETEKENKRLKAEAKEKEDAQKEKDRLAKIESDKKDAIIAKQKSDAQAEVERLEKIETERLAKIEADKKAPIKKQLEVWVNSFQNEIPEQLRDNEIANEILSKFWSFKSWANNQVNNL